MRPYAIFFGVSDDYSFALANVLMGLRQHSSQLMKQCDVIVYHDGIQEHTRKLLNSLHDAVFFEDMVFPQQWEELLEDGDTLRWGKYVAVKLFGYRLISTYEKALFLDCDMLVRGDISRLFELPGEMAWRNVLGWSLAVEDMLIPGGNGGLILFTSSLRKYHITDDTVAQVFTQIRDIHRGGTDERIITRIAVNHQIPVHILDKMVYNTPTYFDNPESKILHFLDYKGVCTKPWKNPAAFAYFTDWAENYKAWLDMGGSGLVTFSKEMCFAPCGREERASYEAQIRELKTENSRLRKQLQWTEAQRDEVLQSEFWKITYPLRWLIRKLKKLFTKR